jgi:hypothetical protein
MNDPLVNEIRQFRHEHARQFHDNLAAICDDLRDIQQACGQTVVSFPPKRMSAQTPGQKRVEIVDQVAA